MTRGPSGSQFLILEAYLSSRGPLYKISTRFSWASIGEGRRLMISSNKVFDKGNNFFIVLPNNFFGGVLRSSLVKTRFSFLVILLNSSILLSMIDRNIL